MEAGLGGGIIGLTGITLHAGDGRDADDATPTLLGHRAHEALSPIECGGEISGDHVVPILVRHRHDEFVAGNAGVIDEDLDRAEFGVDLLARLGDRGGVGDVDLKGLGLQALGDDVVGHLHAGLGLRDAKDGVAVGSESFRDGLADAATGSGDEGDAGRVREMHRAFMWKENTLLASG